MAQLDPLNPEPPGHQGRGASTGAPPVTIPDHELLKRIGRGSYGEVWLARSSLGRYRAVKVLRRESFADGRPFDRELSGIRSFEPISRSHEGFVDILQVGINEDQGYFYYVMELGDDDESQQQIDPDKYRPRTLGRELAKHGKLPFSECVKLGLGLTDALAELHRQGLVHRDLKPSNILFVSGIPKLADIGLVSAVDSAVSYVGTEGFIPPEGPGTPQADVYSLGKVLYEASTGRDRQEFPELPAGFDQAPDNKDFLELNEVVLHACHGDIKKRYPSASSMHSDLQMLATGRSVRRLRLLERRFAALKRGAVVALTAICLALLLLYPLYHHWRDAREGRQRQVGASIAYGTRAVESGDLLGALPYFAQALRLDQGQPALERQDRLRFATTLAQCPALVQMWFATQQVDEVEFNSDGSKVLVVENFGRAQVFDARTGAPASAAFGQETFFWRGAVSPDGLRAVLAGEDHTARVWRLANGAEELRLEHPDKVYTAKFSPDGRQIVTGCRDGVLRAWSAADGSPIFAIKAHSDVIHFAGFSPDGTRIVTTSRDSTVRVWSADGKPLGQPLKHNSWVYFAAFGPDELLVTACFDHHARIWNLADSQELLPRLTHVDGVKSAEFSPDGQLILTACLDGTVRLWNRRTHSPWEKAPVLSQGSRATHARFCPDGRYVVTSAIDGTVRLWDLAATTLPENRLPGVLSPDRARIVVRLTNNWEVRDTFSGERITSVAGLAQNASKPILDERGKFLLISATGVQGASVSGDVQLWRCDTGEKISADIVFKEAVSRFIVNADESLLVLSSPTGLCALALPSGALLWQKQCADGLAGISANTAGSAVLAWHTNQVYALDCKTGRELIVPLSLPFPVKHAEFNPRAKTFVTCGADAGFNSCYAQVWDLGNGQPLGSPMAHPDGVTDAAFSTDGQKIVTAGEDFTVRVWDAQTGRPLVAPMRHSAPVMTASFSANNRWIVTGAADGSARVWDSQTGAPLTPRFNCARPVMDARFVGQDEAIVVQGGAGVIQRLDLRPDPHSVDYLENLSRLFSGDVSAMAGEIPVHPQSLPQLWQELTKADNSFALVTSEHAMAWHRSQEEEARREKDWFAAAFHLRQLLKCCPQDSDALVRLQAIEETQRR